jgi:N-acetylmannosamine-6-phosphate 2-epimerase/N-acetylmannosamine kinase
VLAEGRYRTPAQARLAIEAGAYAVVVGSAITRPEHITAWFAEATQKARRIQQGSEPVLAVEIGGTKALVALVAGEKILESRRIVTERARGPGAWLDAVAEAARDWHGRFGTAAVAATGAVNRGRWSSLNPGVLDIPRDFPLVDELSNRLGVSVVGTNDAQAEHGASFVLAQGRIEI